MKLTESRIELEISFGKDQIDDDRAHTLARALRNLLQDGKPQGRAANCLLDPNEQHDQGPDVRWVGVFVHTKGDRVLFFPDIHEVGSIYTPAHGARRVDRTFLLDHVTFDKGGREIHTTMNQPKRHHRVGKPQDVGHGAKFWFGLSLRSIDMLRPVSRRTILRFDVPEADADRRSQALENIQAGGLDRILTLHPEARTTNPEGFFHAKVFVGPVGFHSHDLIRCPLGMPVQGRFRFTAPVYPHRLQISDELELQINTMWYPGKIGSPAIFSFV